MVSPTPGGMTIGTASALNIRMVAVFYPASYGEVVTTISANDAALFDNAELVAPGDNDDDSGARHSEQLYKVDLRDLELKAARARAEAERAERELLEAQMAEQERTMEAESR